MKKIYENPFIKVSKFIKENVITTSVTNEQAAKDTLVGQMNIDSKLADPQVQQVFLTW